MNLSLNTRWCGASKPNLYLERLRKRGCQAMLAGYGKIAPHLNEPLYTRAVRSAMCDALSDGYISWQSIRLADALLSVQGDVGTASQAVRAVGEINL